MQSPQEDFESIAQQQTDQGIVAEFFSFLRHNKKWWLLPIVVVLLMLGVLIAMSSTAAAPFIYTIF